MDIDEIYLLGEFVEREEDYINFDYEVIEKWQVDDEIYIIGRNYDEGQSILLEVLR